MPEKNADVYAIIWAWFVHQWNSQNHLICGVAVAVITSISQAFLNGKKDTALRVLAEAVMCGLIVGATVPLLDDVGLKGTQWVQPISIIIGYYGTSGIRIAMKRGLIPYLSKRFNLKLDKD